MLVGPEAPLIGTPFREVSFPQGGVVGAIVRGEDVIAPRGDDEVQAGDQVVLFALPEAIRPMERLFA